MNKINELINKINKDKNYIIKNFTLQKRLEMIEQIVNYSENDSLSIYDACIIIKNLFTYDEAKEIYNNEKSDLSLLIISLCSSIETKINLFFKNEFNLSLLITCTPLEKNHFFSDVKKTLQQTIVEPIDIINLEKIDALINSDNYESIDDDFLNIIKNLQSSKNKLEIIEKLKFQNIPLIIEITKSFDLEHKIVAAKKYNLLRDKDFHLDLFNTFCDLNLSNEQACRFMEENKIIAATLFGEKNSNLIFDKEYNKCKTDDDKIQFFHNFYIYDALFVYKLISSIENDTNKINLINEFFDRINEYDIANPLLDYYLFSPIICDIEDDKFKIDFIYKNITYLDSWILTNITTSMKEDEVKVKIINDYCQKLNNYDALKIIKSINNISGLNLNNDLVYRLLGKVIFKYHKDLLDKIVNIYSSSNNNISQIIKYYADMDTETRFHFINLLNSKIDKLNINEIENIINLILKISASNAAEVGRLQMEISQVLIDKGQDIKNYDYIDKIEKLFLKNNLPYGIKLFKVFEMLHPDFSELTIHSPLLKSNKLTDREKYDILMNDILKITVNSNVIDTIKYIELLKNDIKALKDLLALKNKNPIKKYDDYEEIYKDSINKVIEIINSWGAVLGFEELESPQNIFEYLNTNLIYSIENWITNIFNKSLNKNFDSLDEIISYIVYKNEKISNINKLKAMKALKNENTFNLKPGDLIKGIKDYDKYLLNLLRNGINCKEFLGASAASDLTNLDTDFSMITKNCDTIRDAIQNTSAVNYSDLLIVLKNNDRFTAANNPENPDKNSTKMELFRTSPHLENYGIRSGVASTEIDFIICKSWNERIGFNIAYNGFYIPVIDTNGKLVFTPQDYDKMRSKMDGLSYFYNDDITISGSVSAPGIEYIVKQIRSDKPITSNKTKLIKETIINQLKVLGYNVQNNLINDLTIKGMELIDTGSTSRGNNNPKTCDFDFILRMDGNEYSDYKKKSELINNLEKLFISLGGNINPGNNPPYRLRYKNVKISGIDEPIEIDISIIKKTNKISYTSDTALQDKMRNLEKKYGSNSDYVRANIVLAKAVLKDAGCYKKINKGLGGIGVENWILQNKGSFINAIEDFLETSQKYETYNEFRQHYSIFDFGENYYENEQHDSHDNFIDNLNQTTYEKMKNALYNFKNEYINAINNNFAEEFIQSIMNKESKDIILEKQKQI